MVYFKEEQKFTQWWIWLIIITTDALIIGGFVLAAYYQLIEGKPWGNEPMSDSWLIIWGLVMISLMLMVTWLFFNAKLEVEIKNNSIYYKYFPFVWSWKIIRKENIKVCAVIEYSPLSDYGGWGYRFSFKNGRALNVKGNTGMKLVYGDGKKLMIGTQKPDELRITMQKMMEEKEEDYG